MPTIQLTKETFESTIVDNETIFVDFWASWCGPCHAFAPVFEKASEKYEHIVFAKVDTEAEQELAGYFQVRSIPTLMVFRDNIMLFNQPGALPEQALESLITQVQDLDMDDVRRQIEAHQAEHQDETQA